MKGIEARRKPLRPHWTRTEYVDLTDYLGIDQFDQTLKAIDKVVNFAGSLALDNADDRAELIERLCCALGKVPERKVRR
jgi:hypothetical protein